MIKLIIFDFDGVIADSLGTAEKVWNKLMKNANRKEKITAEDIKELGIGAVVDKLKIPKIMLPYYLAKAKKMVGSHMKEVKPFKGIKQVIIKLAKSKKLAIVSSNSEQNIIEFLEKNGMENYFDLIIADVGLFGKAKKMQKASKELNINPLQVLCVGDEERDILASKKAGMKIVCVTYGYNSKKLLSKHNVEMASSPTILAKILNKNIL